MIDSDVDKVCKAALKVAKENDVHILAVFATVLGRKVKGRFTPIEKWCEYALGTDLRHAAEADPIPGLDVTPVIDAADQCLTVHADLWRNMIAKQRAPMPPLVKERIQNEPATMSLRDLENKYGYRAQNITKLRKHIGDEAAEARKQQQSRLAEKREADRRIEKSLRLPMESNNHPGYSCGPNSDTGSCRVVVRQLRRLYETKVASDTEWAGFGLESDEAVESWTDLAELAKAIKVDVRERCPDATPTLDGYADAGTLLKLCELIILRDWRQCNFPDPEPTEQKPEWCVVMELWKERGQPGNYLDFLCDYRAGKISS